ncbi:anti-sigma factor [Bacteroidia bacterium]|nr:anti-sigma factor [Bacteroidia bacterium]
MDNETLQRYVEGNASQEEKEAIAVWLDADEKNMQDMLALRTIYDASLWNGTEETAEQPTPIHHKKRIQFVYELLKIAAVFILATGGYHLFFITHPNTPEPAIAIQTVYAPEGQRTEIQLGDGTKVWLNANTSFTFPNPFSETERRVELIGEAYFEVAKDESKPFIVAVKGYQVKVLGTEFDVKAYLQDDGFETALLKGSVEVSSDQTGEKLVLTPNSMVYAENGRLRLSKLQHIEHFLWKQGIIAFENESVEEIFKTMQLYYNIKIDIRKASILKDHYTGKFRTEHGIEHVLRVLQIQHKFRFKKDIDTNTIIIY